MFAEQAFRREPELRYVGIVDEVFRVVLSKMREGIQSLTMDERERSFVQFMPPIIIDAIEKLQPLLGRVDNVTVRYEKVLLVFFRMQKFFVTFGFDPEVSTPFISSLSDSMRRLGEAYLT